MRLMCLTLRFFLTELESQVSELLVHLALHLLVLDNLLLQQFCFKLLLVEMRLCHKKVFLGVLVFLLEEVSNILLSGTVILCPT